MVLVVDICIKLKDVINTESGVLKVSTTGCQVEQLIQSSRTPFTKRCEESF